MRSLTLPRAVSAAGTLLLAVGLVVAVSQVHYAGAPVVFVAGAILATLAAAGLLIWFVEPVYIFCGALLLSPMAGNWSYAGLPGAAAPDRLLLIAAVGAVLLRAPTAADRPMLRIRGVHWLMLASGVYVVVSAAAAGSLFERAPFFRLFEAFGILPFLVFLAAPVAFRTARQRDTLLKTFVLLGAYLGLTTLFEKVGLRQLVFPRFILDPSVGYHAGRGRGPFLEAVTNGFGCYTCAVMCGVAAWRWRERRNARAVAVAVALVALTGAFLSLERSVWLGAVVATLVAAAAIRDIRSYAPALLAIVAVAGASLLLIPGFRDEVTQRSNDKQTVWDRKNMDRAAVNMIEARPLFGFGWNRLTDYNHDYFELAPDYPITQNVANLRFHNTPLTYGAELGLVGLLLWAAVLLTGVGGALATRGPPDLRGWRIALLAVATCYLVVTNFVPPSVFPNLALWLLAGVAWAGRYRENDEVTQADAGMTFPAL